MTKTQINTKTKMTIRDPIIQCIGWNFGITIFPSSKKAIPSHFAWFFLDPDPDSDIFTW